MKSYQFMVPWSVASKHSALLVSNQNISLCHSGHAINGL